MPTGLLDNRDSDWPELMAILADCVARLGDEAFGDHLTTLLRRSLGVEQCILFAYTRNDTMSYLLVDNSRYPKVAGRLARLYAGGLFRQDPNYPRLRQLLRAGDGQANAELISMPEEMSPAYRSHLFAFPDLADKASIMIPALDTLYYLNLYRDLARGPFSRQELEDLQSLTPLIASLIRRHYRQARPATLPARHEDAEALQALSKRERELCLLLLHGHTLKTAAAELDIAPSTADTFRKRAYAKLGVRSKAGLLALCRYQ
ncbi:MULTISPECIES: helix-turn-helix transcriptional regulator [unclassified Halomonas]|uniref:helix-turn-helix transcriptional regulator n=1 Tax=unclassified Halomonas TaxID=2609666 RepID=UPI002883D8D0|nr:MULTISPECIES: helix-turn-helix transcriptional regulator [unclassified Halomonas]MDT0502520.1 helix-turn-helix transcriptional regulator [Halomonas sp. PAR7]MDT0512752.1 helix-turn-helix transcriptional regulator [Halomonas sp. LES1]MDT0591930.1 helix-turn-helix transcriptional regulator [Halomonas sp. PAR8]